MKKLIILVLAACLLAGCCPVGEGADMAKYSYNGVVLPALPDYDKEAYPYAYISIGRDKTYALLVVSDKLGYLSPTVGTGGEILSYGYTLGLSSDDEYDESKIIYARQYLVALDAASAESLESLWPGISDTAWMEEEWDMESFGIPEGSYYLLPAEEEGPIWANVALYTEDGNLFIEGSEPVRVFDLKSFLTGLTLGLAGKPVLMGGQKTPVAYLYNGVRLPKLPEWDVESYPYAAMSYADVSAIVPDTFKANLYFMSDPIIFKSVTTGYSGTGSVVKYQIIISENFEIALEWADSIGIHENVTETDKWFKCETNEWADIDNFRGTSFEWANFDILKESDNSVYVSASEPVPVYE